MRNTLTAKSVSLSRRKFLLCSGVVSGVIATRLCVADQCIARSAIERKSSATPSLVSHVHIVDSCLPAITSSRLAFIKQLKSGGAVLYDLKGKSAKQYESTFLKLLDSEKTISGHCRLSEVCQFERLAWTKNAGLKLSRLQLTKGQSQWVTHSQPVFDKLRDQQGLMQVLATTDWQQQPFHVAVPQMQAVDLEQTVFWVMARMV